MSTKTPHGDKENTFTDTQGRAGKNETFSNEALPEKIGTNLRQIYDDVLAEPVPDDFLNLLAKADKTTP